jgi:hypothetical protein
MKYTKLNEMKAMNIVAKHRLVKDRVLELTRKGFHVAYKNIGTGGVGTLKKLKGEWRLQIGYAKGGGYANYAECVIFEPSNLQSNNLKK